MAHWIIDDHGFGGVYYTCSACGKTRNDLYHDVPDDICPDCGEPINDDENEYAEKANSTPSSTTDELITNQEAAKIIREIVAGVVIPRGCAKTTGILMRIAALCKAIEVLEGDSNADIQ